MEISNKEVIEKLTKYLLKQDFNIVCRLLAGCMIDYNRLYYFEDLPVDERERLMVRIKANSEQLNKFIENKFIEQETLTPFYYED